MNNRGFVYDSATYAAIRLEREEEIKKGAAGFQQATDRINNILEKNSEARKASRTASRMASLSGRAKKASKNVTVSNVYLADPMINRKPVNRPVLPPLPPEEPFLEKVRRRATDAFSDIRFRAANVYDGMKGVPYDNPPTKKQAVIMAATCIALCGLALAPDIVNEALASNDETPAIEMSDPTFGHEAAIASIANQAGYGNNYYDEADRTSINNAYNFVLAKYGQEKLDQAIFDYENPTKSLSV